MKMFIVRFEHYNYEDGEPSGIYPVCVVLQASNEKAAKKRAKEALAKSTILFEDAAEYRIKSCSAGPPNATVVMNVVEE